MQKRSNINVSIVLICLTGCASWNEEFEDKVIRAYPQASIHKLSRMTDNGMIKDIDDDWVMITDAKSQLKIFKDGEVSRGIEDVRRMYMMTYEDSSNNLHFAHHLYLVVKPAEWEVK